MRTFRLGIWILLVAVVAGILWLALHRPEPQVVVLPDGSQLTLLKVTHGTNHVYRFGNRWQDFLYPVLPVKLRAKFPPRLMAFDSYNRDSVMVWFRRDGQPTSAVAATKVYLSVADEHGLESSLQLMAHTTRTTGSLTTATNATGTQFSGWELAGYPKRSRQFRVVVYHPADAKLSRVGEFRIPNQVRRKFPEWTAEALPATRQTNGLKVTLAKLETGLSGAMAGAGVRIPARVFSRATFRLHESGAPTTNWCVSKIRLTSATGETRYGDSKSGQWQDGEFIADVWGGIWLEEPAWKVEASFVRSANYLAEDLWKIKGVPMPQPGEKVDHRAETTLHSVTMEFVGVSAPLKAVFPADQLMPVYVAIRVRTPYPLEDVSVALVEVRDDRGRIAQPQGSTSALGTGSGGNTPKETLTDFRVAIPLGAKSLDITLAATPVRHVEFLAKPVLTRPLLTD